MVAAESCLALQRFQTTQRLLTEFYDQNITNPPQDQFFCRAKLIQAQLLHAENSSKVGIERVNGIKDALKYVLTALEVAISPKNSTSYQFIVFNCSKIAYFIVNGILFSCRARHISMEMQKITNALEASNEKEKLWRVQMLSATAFCAFDEEPSQSKLAGDYLDKAFSLLNGLLNEKSEEEKKSLLKLSTCVNEYEACKADLMTTEASPSEEGIHSDEKEEEKVRLKLTALQKTKYEIETELKQIRTGTFYSSS